MDLKHLTDETLVADTKRLAKEERTLLIVILHHLREIERRRLFANYDCRSIHHYAVKELGYSEPEAQRRVTAMYSLLGVPQVEDAIARGVITLTHIGIAESMFRNEERAGRELSCEEKAEVFEAIAGKTTREAAKTMFDFSPEPVRKKDQIKVVGRDLNELRIGTSDDTLAKLQRLQGLVAHKKLSLDQLLNQLCDLGLREFSPAKEPTVTRAKESKAATKRQIWKRDESKCTNCGSTHAIQEDHILPRSMGGEYTIENMRLLCRGCNQRAAIEKLGQNKMDQHLRRSQLAAPQVQKISAQQNPIYRRAPVETSDQMTFEL